MAAKVKVRTPVEGFTGVVVGVHFIDGVGETEDPAALAYFTRRGYPMEQPKKRAPAKPDAAKSGE